jgi:hypothetical protein
MDFAFELYTLRGPNHLDERQWEMIRALKTQQSFVWMRIRTADLVPARVTGANDVDVAGFPKFLCSCHFLHRTSLGLGVRLGVAESTMVRNVLREIADPLAAEALVINDGRVGAGPLMLDTFIICFASKAVLAWRERRCFRLASRIPGASARRA